MLWPPSRADPALATEDKSDVFLSFQHNYDLFANAATAVDGDRPGRRGTRRAATARKGSVLQAEAGPSSARKKLDLKGKGRAEEPALMFVQPQATHINGDAFADLKRKRSGGRGKKGRRSAAGTEADYQEDYAMLPPAASVGRSTGRRRSSFAEPDGDIGSLPLPHDAIVASLTELASFYQRPASPSGGPPSKRVKSTHGGDPNATYSHYQQLPPVPPFEGSLSSLFATYFNTLDDVDAEPPPPEEELDERAEYDADILLQLDALRAQGVELLNPDQERSVEPDRIVDHQQHLVDHAVHFSKLVHDERKAHMAMGRKIGRMVLGHFANLRGKEERVAKDEEKQSKALARSTMKEVKKKWKLAINVSR